MPCYPSRNTGQSTSATVDKITRNTTFRISGASDVNEVNVLDDLIQQKSCHYLVSKSRRVSTEHRRKRGSSTVATRNPGTRGWTRAGFVETLQVGDGNDSGVERKWRFLVRKKLERRADTRSFFPGEDAQGLGQPFVGTSRPMPEFVVTRKC